MLRTVTIFILLISLLTACRDDSMHPLKRKEARHKGHSSPSGSIPVQGIVRIKLTSEAGRRISIEGLRCNIESIDTYLKEIGATSISRTFPYSPRYEGRTQRAGLHLWYDIRFDDKRSLRSIVGKTVKLPEIEIVEQLYRPTLPHGNVTALDLTGLRGGPVSPMPYNDIGLNTQWNYRNTGAYQGHSQGADINLFDAWRETTGRKEVIVAIMDGGIDVGHEDLEDAMFVNLKELKGTPGTDDDGNGFTDDIHGYNFVAESPRLSPHTHGTHVAGIIGARTNNGRGIAGIAGGNGTQESGVRLLSCQIFQHSRPGLPDLAIDAAVAFKYAADMGAVIAQNSWGYGFPAPDDISPSLRAAIDYFILNAGCDNTGAQRPGSMMKGGVVIFSAGNNYRDFRAYPAAYAPVISVSAMAPDYTVADYSNRGDWVSIMAPGGSEWYTHGEILSTLPSRDGKSRYGYMSGTSMACPHVSGIAALIVSKFGGNGFTNTMLRHRLLNSLRPTDIDRMNPDYRGRLGAGYVDATRALMPYSQTPPLAVSEASITNTSGLGITFPAVRDADDGSAAIYMIYCAEREMDVANFKEIGADHTCKVKAHHAKPGDLLTASLSGLTSDRTYHIAIIAIDRWGEESQPFFTSGKTAANQAPELSLIDHNFIRITPKDGFATERKIIVREPEGQSWSYTLSGEQRGITAEASVDGVTLRFSALAPIGRHRLTLHVNDAGGAAASFEIPFEIYENTAPILTKPLHRLFLSVNGRPKVVHLKEYFSDTDRDQLAFDVRASVPDIVRVSINGGIMGVTGMREGTTALIITARDAHGLEVQSRLDVSVIEKSIVHYIYPIPASNELNVRLAEHVTGALITIRSTTGVPIKSYEITLPEGDEPIAVLDISTLSVGTYILTVESGTKSFKQSFIKI